MDAKSSEVSDTKGTDTTQGDTTDAWKDVEKRFTALSESLVSAVRTAWQDEESQRAINEMESGLRSLASDVAAVVDEAAKSPEGKKLRVEAERTARAVQEASQQVVKDTRPQVARVLASISDSLRSAADELTRYSSKHAGKVGDSDQPES